MMDQHKRMSQCIEELLEVVAVEKAKGPNHHIDFSKLLRDRLQPLKKDALSHSLLIKSNIEPNVMMMVNHRMITLMVDHLFSNAIRFASHSLFISLTTDEKEIIFTIIDDGPGIRQGETEFIWNRFFTGKNQALRNPKIGAGLGLSIVKKVVEMYHGHITVENNPHAGVTFTLFFPK